MSDPGPAAVGPATAEQVSVFEDEVRDAVRYERGLAMKCVASILLVAIVLVLRVHFFG